MDPGVLALLAAAILVVVAAGIGFVFIKVLKSPGSDEPAKQETEPDEQEVQTGARAGRRGAADRMRAGRLRQRAAANQQAAAEREAAAQAARQRFDSESSAGSDEDDDEEVEEEGAGVPQTKKERAKQARREAREAERAAREARERKTSAYDEKRKKKDEERDARERAQEEEIKRAEEERQRKEDEEASKWMSMISVEKEGTGEAEDQEESQGLLGQFIDYIKARKTVPLEQLATEFKLRTTDVIDRIHGLEAMGRLTGVMDERGKYIYISLEEMQAVANYIVTKGRVAISELAARSNTFIDLESKGVEAAVAGRPAMDFDALLGGTDAVGVSA